MKDKTPKWAHGFLRATQLAWVGSLVINWLFSGVEPQLRKTITMKVFSEQLD